MYTETQSKFPATLTVFELHDKLICDFSEWKTFARSFLLWVSLFSWNTAWTLLITILSERTAWAVRWIASTCCVSQDKKSTWNCLYIHTEVTVKEGIFIYQLPHRDFIIRFSSFSGSLFSNESYSYGKRRVSFCLQVTWFFLASNLGEVFTAGKQLWLDIGRVFTIQSTSINGKPPI